ncbi:MAG: CDP-alcohol phosphatidyltransferase family protein, partial [Gammaproteobacteria bacterium]|nr:CDP-alcohol phosphatidyltransferase family protein [Gammaproteobacteria bacterium]
PFSELTVALVVLLAMLSEFTGVIGPTIGASRRYDGPSGKSDRALIFAALGLWVGIGGVLPSWMFWLMPVLALLLCITIVNRIKQALAEVK